MKAADFEKLKDKIALPDFDKHLVPLMLYRGSTGLGRMSRLWNFAITCMESDVANYRQAVKLSHNPDFAHLAGPHKPLQMSTLPGLFWRLDQNPFVTDNIPGLTEWVRSVRGWRASLTPISLYTNDPYHQARFAPWRIADFRPEVKEAMEAARSAKAVERDRRRAEKLAEQRRQAMLSRRPQERLAYPYLAYRPVNGQSELRLVEAVTAAVPRNLPDWIRADICQDLLVAILAGEIELSALAGSIRPAMSKVLRMHPLKYGPLSTDEMTFDDSATTRIDSLALEAA